MEAVLSSAVVASSKLIQADAEAWYTVYGPGVIYQGFADMDEVQAFVEKPVVSSRYIYFTVDACKRYNLQCVSLLSATCKYAVVVDVFSENMRSTLLYPSTSSPIPVCETVDIHEGLLQYIPPEPAKEIPDAILDQLSAKIRAYIQEKSESTTTKPLYFITDDDITEIQKEVFTVYASDLPSSNSAHISMIWNSATDYSVAVPVWAHDIDGYTDTVWLCPRVAGAAVVD